jgi:hypothetical protein
MLMEGIEGAAEDEVLDLIAVQGHADAEIQQRLERPLRPRRLDGFDILFAQVSDKPKTEADVCVRGGGVEVERWGGAVTSSMFPYVNGFACSCRFDI